MSTVSHIPGQASAAPAVPRASTEELRRKKFTRQEVEQLLETGIFAGSRYELIDGDLIDKMGHNPAHAYAIQLLQDWLMKLFGAGRIRGQLPIELAARDGERSVPEPDLVLLTEAKPDYRRRHPRADELLLAIEVSDTSAAFDLGRKAELYARANLPEYWVLDLSRRLLVIHRESDGQQYRSIQLYSAEDSVAVPGTSDGKLQVSAILPAEE